jgi:hypothetical protein
VKALLALLVALLLVAPATALAQEGDAFGPLPPAQTPAPEPIVLEDDSGDAGDVSPTILAVIGGGLLLTFLVIGRFIFRDARAHVPADARDRPGALREEGPHRHGKQAKARARSRTKAQRAARRKNR